MIDDPVIKSYREQVEDGLDRFLPAEEDRPVRLHSAMRYSVMNGGKRLRPVITLATGALFTDRVRERVLPAACAVELIHSYSLIHDDLPSMDDDDVRRGVPSCHAKFDVATAILAGDALQALAFEILCSSPDEVPVRELVRELSGAAGSRKLVGGQQLDLDQAGSEGSLDELTDQHERKTAGLMVGAFRMGVRAGGGSERDLERITEAAEPIGLAFQIVDDVLDVKGTSEDLGKTAGKDEESDKLTYPALLGVDASVQRADELLTTALDRLESFGDRAEPLRKIGRFILNRSY